MTKWIKEKIKKLYNYQKEFSRETNTTQKQNQLKHRSEQGKSTKILKWEI